MLGVEEYSAKRPRTAANADPPTLYGIPVSGSVGEPVLGLQADFEIEYSGSSRVGGVPPADLVPQSYDFTLESQFQADLSNADTNSEFLAFGDVQHQRSSIPMEDRGGLVQLESKPRARMQGDAKEAAAAQAEVFTPYQCPKLPFSFATRHCGEVVEVLRWRQYSPQM